MERGCYLPAYIFATMRGESILSWCETYEPVAPGQQPLPVRNVLGPGKESDPFPDAENSCSHTVTVGEVFPVHEKAVGSGIEIDDSTCPDDVPGDFFLDGRRDEHPDQAPPPQMDLALSCLRLADGAEVEGYRFSGEQGVFAWLPQRTTFASTFPSVMTMFRTHDVLPSRVEKDRGVGRT